MSVEILTCAALQIYATLGAAKIKRLFWIDQLFQILLTGKDKEQFMISVNLKM